jgi:hypothetical protein
MSRPRKKNEREKRRPPRQPEPTKKWHHKLLGWFLGFCTALGIIALWPRVTIEPEGQIDPSNPHPIYFKITNTGFVPLRDVDPFIGLCVYFAGEPRNLPERCEGPLGARFLMSQWHVRWLARDEPTKIRLDDALNIGPQLGGADISVGLVFSVWMIPLLRVPIEYRFQTHVERDGKLSWIPRPLNK